MEFFFSFYWLVDDDQAAQKRGQTLDCADDKRETLERSSACSDFLLSRGDATAQAECTMSGKRRKNAGEGYGYMFSGAFSKKSDAVKKEKTRKGSFIKGTPTNQGYRYIVMTPRTNPIKRKKKAPKDPGAYTPRITPAKNPSELLVLGANPHSNNQEIVLQPGATLTIRNNPEPRPNTLGSFLGFSPSRPSKKELAKSKREFKGRVRQHVGENREYYKQLRGSARSSSKGQSKLNQLFHEVYGRENPGAICGAMIGGEPCTRKPGHRPPHLPQGATMRTRSRLRSGWKPRGNPSAEALREKFTGKEVERIRIFDEPHMPAGDYAMLGKLLALYVKPRIGGQVLNIEFAGVTLVSDESARQIYFVGGDQDISAGLASFGAVDRGAGLFELGEARRIDYKQRKEHVPHPESDSWRHEFGEENGIRPIALFDSQNKRILLEGGDYTIREEGIIN